MATCAQGLRKGGIPLKVEAQRRGEMTLCRSELTMAGLVEPGALSGVWPDGSRGHA